MEVSGGDGEGEGIGGGGVHAEPQPQPQASVSDAMAARIASDVVQYMLPPHDTSGDLFSLGDDVDWTCVIDALLASSSEADVDSMAPSSTTTPPAEPASRGVKRGGNSMDDTMETPENACSAQKKSKQKKQKRSQATTSTRRRDEIQELRATVEQLKLVLKQEAQRRHGDSPTLASDPLVARSTSGTFMTWEQMAAQQYTSRREAEMENARLRRWRDDELSHALRVLQKLDQLPDECSMHPVAVLRQHARRLLTNGSLVTYQACQPAPQLTPAMRHEHMRHLQLLAQQAELMFATPWFASSVPFRHGEVTSDPRAGGALVELRGAYLTSFTVAAVTDVLWNEPIRTVGLLHEEQHLNETRDVTRITQLDKKWCQSDHPGASFRMGTASRLSWGHDAEGKPTTTSILCVASAQPEDVADTSKEASLWPFQVRGEDWLRILPAPRDERAASTATTKQPSSSGALSSPSVSSSSSPLTVVQWCRRMHVTLASEPPSPSSVPSPSPLASGAVANSSTETEIALRHFAEELATHFADDMLFCQRVAEELLRHNYTDTEIESAPS